MQKFIHISGAAIVASCLFPTGVAWWAESFAARNGCTLTDIGTHPCFVGGIDWADRLAIADVTGHLQSAALPVALVTALGVTLLTILGQTGGGRRH